MPHLDADAERAALEPFVLTIGGRTYTARPLSWPAYRQATEAAVRLQQGEIGIRAYDEALRTALRSAFPFRFRYLRNVLRRDPVNLVMLETPAIRLRIIESFFEWARRQIERAQELSGTSGPSAPASSLAASP